MGAVYVSHRSTRALTLADLEDATDEDEVAEEEAKPTVLMQADLKKAKEGIKKVKSKPTVRDEHTYSVSDLRKWRSQPHCQSADPRMLRRLGEVASESAQAQLVASRQAVLIKIKAEAARTA